MSCSILIIEDNHTNMELMVYLLNAFGYKVVSAFDGQQGMELVLTDPPDLILCDLEMPKLNGYEVIANLRAQSALPPIPTVAVTALAMVGDRDRVLACGFHGYISKPINPETFIDEVEVFIAVDKRPARTKLSNDDSFVCVPPPHRNRALVLLVDDSHVNVDLIRSTLEPSGYTVISASNVAGGMELAQQNPIDLIVSDLHMSPESGLSFLRHIKEDERLKIIPFILLTSSMTDPMDGTGDRARDLGATKFLSRPISPQQLIHEVEECLAQR